MLKNLFLLLVFFSLNLFALSNEAEIDILKIKLVEQQKKGDYKAIINSISKWKELDSNIPISLLFWQGKAYFNIKEYIKSYNALETYINTAGNSGRFYNDALKLYLQIEPIYEKELLKEEKRKQFKNRVVKFEDTGLMWQDDYAAISKTMTTKEARVYCQKLVTSGYVDWRLPTANELVTIIDYIKKPAIKKEFNNDETYYYLINENNYKKTFFLSTYNGDIKVNSKNNYKAYVRCVRDLK